MSGLELAGGVSVAWGAALLGAAALVGFLAGALGAARGRRLPRRAAAGLLYALAGAALALVLLGPRAVAVSDKETPPRFAVLVDRSISMREADLPGGEPRSRLAGRLLAAGSPLRRTLEKRARPTYLAFDAGVRPLDFEALKEPPSGAATDLVSGFESALGSPGVGPLAGALLVTDGRVTRGVPLALRAEELLRRGVPVWVAGAGDPAAPRRPRLSVAGIEVPESTAIGEEVAVDASLRASGLAGGKVTVRFLVDGRALERRELPAAERLPVGFAYSPRAKGVRRLEVQAGAAGGQLAARASRYLVVTGRPLRALYAEGRLGWGYRELAASLASAPQSQVEPWAGFVLPAGGNRARELDLAGRLGRLDVVVLGDLDAGRLGRKGLAALARAVREDGLGLLFAAGPQVAASYDGTPLERLIPVSLRYGKAAGGARGVGLAGGAERPEPLRLDRSGQVDHRLWRSLPETTAAWKPGSLRRGARVWLRAGADPALVAWRAGQGRVAVLAWPDHWRWAHSGADGAEAHRRLFSRLAAWLAGREESGGGKLAASLTRYRLSPGEQVSLLARLLEAPPESGRLRMTARLARLEARDKKVEELNLEPVEPRRFRAGLRAAAPGQYRIELLARSLGEEWARAELFFSVEASGVEMDNPAPDFSALRRLAEASGGAFVGPAEIERLPALIAARLPQPGRRTRRTRREMWDRLGLLAAALGALAVAWILLREGPGEERGT